MKCQIPGCKNKADKITTKKNQIIYGVNIETITLFTCANHTSEEINECNNKALEKEYKKNKIMCNPFLEVSKLKTK